MTLGEPFNFSEIPNGIVFLRIALTGTIQLFLASHGQATPPCFSNISSNVTSLVSPLPTPNHPLDYPLAIISHHLFPLFICLCFRHLPSLLPTRFLAPPWQAFLLYVHLSQNWKKYAWQTIGACRILVEQVSKWMHALKKFLPLGEVESILQDNALWAVIWLQPTNRHFIPMPIWELKMPTPSKKIKNWKLLTQDIH